MHEYRAGAVCDDTIDQVDTRTHVLNRGPQRAEHLDADVEAETGHRFRADLSMAEIIAESQAGQQGAFIALADLHPIRA